MNKKEVITRFDNRISQYIRSFSKKIWNSPQTLSIHIRNKASKISYLSDYKKIIVAGETDNLSIYLISKYDIIIYTPFMETLQNIIFVETSPKLLMKYTDHIYLIEKTKKIMNRLSFPKVVLINPSVRDIFPIPRLALCVSSLAGYLRKYQKAEVFIIDMQIGSRIETLIGEIREIQPDIIGISISFGQIGVATSVLERIFSDKEIMARNPLVISGNAISAFGYKELIKRFPSLIVCNGEGELSVTGLVDYVKGKIDIDSVPGITYLKERRIKRTPIIEVNMNELPLPSMDTVEGIIRNNGALTMEISRGCSHSACSFCPRTHKPVKWKGMSTINVLKQLEQYKQIFDNFGVEKRIFMADEEFIGWMENDEEGKRITNIMRGMINRDFNIHFETNTRIDRIYNPQKGKPWHIKRMKMLTLCKKAGLDRLLVGVESGSDSILKRFNKNMKSSDSIMGIRILTSLGIGLRITFITFDPLMNFSELKENIIFLERRDLYLKPIALTKVSYSELFNAIHDDNFVRANLLNVPFYEYVAYMLVLLDVLANCDYIRLLSEEEIERGRALFVNNRKLDINMARYKVSYVDKTIGDIAISCQKWIDRHFALDYCLKGIYKTASDTEREMIFRCRVEYRKISFYLLKSLVWMFDKENTININDNIVNKDKLIQLRQMWGRKSTNDITMNTIDLFNEKMRLMVDEVENAVNTGKIHNNNKVLKRVIDYWRKDKGWSLINP